jgi:hypothetical protein
MAEGGRNSACQWGTGITCDIRRGDVSLCYKHGKILSFLLRTRYKLLSFALCESIQELNGARFDAVKLPA